jgi:hypothetical protein
MKVFGPVNTDNVWRIRNNMEIDNLIEGANTVRFIKAQSIKWLGHIQRMDQARPPRKLLDWKPMGTRPVGKPRRWKENVVEDLKKLKSKTGRRQLRIEELRETWLRRREPTKGCMPDDDDDDDGPTYNLPCDTKIHIHRIHRSCNIESFHAKLLSAFLVYSMLRIPPI